MKNEKVSDINEAISVNEFSLRKTNKTTVRVDQDHLAKNKIFLRGYDEESLVAISAYKSLRTHMLRQMTLHKANTLLITGTTKGVGKSVTAANLAINIARHQEKHVLLIDLDLRSPSLANLFGLTPKSGIDQVMTKGFNFQKSIVYPNIKNLSILPCVYGHENSTEILLSRQMQSLLEPLRRLSDNNIVIFDSPPLLGCDDVPALVSMMDLSLVVVGEGDTTRKELKHGLTTLGDVPIAGIVLNKSSQKFFKRYYY